MNLFLSVNHYGLVYYLIKVVRLTMHCYFNTMGISNCIYRSCCMIVFEIYVWSLFLRQLTEKTLNVWISNNIDEFEY